MALAEHFQSLEPPEPPQVTLEEVQPIIPEPPVKEAVPEQVESRVEIARILYDLLLPPFPHLLKGNHRRGSS